MLLAYLQGHLEPGLTPGQPWGMSLSDSLLCQQLPILSCAPGALTDPALLACQDGFVQTARLMACTQFPCCGPAFWLLWLIDSRMCLQDQLPLNPLDTETCMGFRGQRPSTHDPVVLGHRKSVSAWARMQRPAGEPVRGFSGPRQCVSFPAALALPPLL